ncbi:Vacuolar protein-sorting-associated protein 36 [Homalodisca vitripennis]|nr:Vacuolar protein-sorting-associated protein 36 [Homalodisca vitripennis]
MFIYKRFQINCQDCQINKCFVQLKDSGSLSAEQLAQELGISVILAKERLLATEKAGKACRDDTIEGLRFYPNMFLEAV